MEEDEKKTPESLEQQTEASPNLDQAPADALSRTPDELEEQAERESKDSSSQITPQSEYKKPSFVRRIWRKTNIYILLFVLIVVISSAIVIVNYLNSQKEPDLPNIASKELTEEELRQLANTDTNVGDTSQTLTIRGNAIIDGQTLMRGNLNVAGNFQSGGSIQGPTITISGLANIGQAQINSLQVAADVAIQGNSTLRDLNVAGTSSFSGPMTASRISVTELVLSGNARLEIPNHISFVGPTPSHTINTGPLGTGGSASISGSDTAGVVNINTGNNPVAGCIVRVNFNQRFSNQPHVLISPVGNAAGRTQYYVERDQGGFSICTTSPAPGNQSFAFDYFVTY